jgi:hypothetical protein
VWKYDKRGRTPYEIYNDGNPPSQPRHPERVRAFERACAVMAMQLEMQMAKAMAGGAVARAAGAA